MTTSTLQVYRPNNKKNQVGFNDFDHQDFPILKMDFLSHTTLSSEPMIILDSDIEGKCIVIINDKAEITLLDKILISGNVYLMSSKDCETVRNLDGYNKTSKYLEKHNFKPVYYDGEILSAHIGKLRELHDQHYNDELFNIHKLESYGY